MKTFQFIDTKNTAYNLHCKIFHKAHKKLVEWRPLKQQVALNSSQLQFHRDLNAKNVKLKSKHAIINY